MGESNTSGVTHSGEPAELKESHEQQASERPADMVPALGPIETGPRKTLLRAITHWLNPEILQPIVPFLGKSVAVVGHPPPKAHSLRRNIQVHGCLTREVTVTGARETQSPQSRSFCFENWFGNGRDCGEAFEKGRNLWTGETIVMVLPLHLNTQEPGLDHFCQMRARSLWRNPRLMGQFSRRKGSPIP